MKRNFCFALCFLMIAIGSVSYSQNWLWAKGAGGTGVGEGYSICTDAIGNVFVTGCFSSFNNSIITFGSTTLTNVDPTGNTADIFIVKYDASGNVLWAKRAGGIDNDISYSINGDANGNVIVTGRFQSPTIAFGSTTLTNADLTGNTSDIFIAKYDASGNVLWAKRAGGTGSDAANSVSVDLGGNIFLTGEFNSPSITFGSTTLTNSGINNIFLAKYDANGNVLWAKKAGGTSADYGYSVSADAGGNVFVTGNFSSSNIIFGSITLTNAGGNDVFIAKYDANGNVLWAKSAVGSSVYGLSVSADVGGNVFVAGEFVFNITFSPITLTLTGNGMFLAKYDANGNVLWAKSAKSTGSFGYSVSTDAGGNAFLTGGFFGNTIIFGIDTITTPSGSNGSPMFIVKYDANGNVLCASALASGGSHTIGERWNSVSIDLLGNAYITGGFAINSFIVGTDTLVLTGQANVFVAKWNCGCSLATPSINGNTTICSGQIATLTANPIGGTYSWNNGYTSNSISVSPTSTSTYSVIVSSGSCSNTASVTVTVSPLPTVSFSGNTTVCSGQSSALIASGGINYLWSNYSTTSTIIVSPTSTSTYSVSVSNGLCSADTNITITVNPLPTAVISGSSNICSGQTTILTVSGGGDYLWSTSVTTNTISVSPTVTTSYSVTVTDANGCTNTTSAATNVTTTPVATISPNSTICSGSTITLNASGGANYSWNTGGTTSSIQVNPNTATNYSVLVSNGNCFDTAYTSIFVNPLPSPTASTSTTTITFGESATLTVSGGTNYSWSNGENGNIISVSPTETTQYCVTATDTNNCSNTACVTIDFYDMCSHGIYLPNAFSPNNDGDNDFLQVYFENLLCVTSLHITVYDRWGEKVYESTDPTFKWDGSYNGKIMDTQVLTYALNATIIDNKTISKKGNVSLMR